VQLQSDVRCCRFTREGVDI
jgi:Uncharacterized protein conserved in bacteria